MNKIILEPEPKMFVCWSQSRSQSRSLKVEFLIRSPAVAYCSLRYKNAFAKAHFVLCFSISKVLQNFVQF